MNIGMQLRQAREARGLSLDALASMTRIQRRVLDGIERNDLTAIPPRPYARGFVATYAREMGLDADATARSYFSQFEPAPVRESVTRQPQRTFDWSHRPRRVAVELVMAVLAVAVVTVWVTKRTRLPIVASEPQAVGTTGTAPAPIVPALLAETAPPAPAAIGTGHVTIALQADRPAWVSASADGTRVVYRVLEPGPPITLRAERNITVRVGNAGWVRMSVKGAPFAPMGRVGEVRTVTVQGNSPPAR